MQPIEAYKPLLPLALAVLVLGLVFIVWKWPGGKDLTFSQHVARRRSSIIYYCLLFAVVLPPLNLFVIGWFVPTFALTYWFGIFVLVASILQFAATLIPETGSWKTTCHRLLAGCSAACLVPPIIIIILAGTISHTSELVAVVALLVMTGSAFVVVRNGGKHRYFLLLQSAYYTTFFLVMLVAAYLH